jgi:dipeptidyl aminopeptidase/acylaminoacyl peptidase
MNRSAILIGLAIAVLACAPTRADEPAIPVPETIRVQGVPPIPMSVRKALSRYQDIRSASFQDWASDGSGMYIITRFADVPQVHFVAQAGGARAQLTFLPERVLSVSARPKHDQFLYTVDEGGAENYQFYLQDRKGGEARQVTDGKSRNVAPKWSPSGELLAWSSNARNGRDMDLYVAAPADPHFVRRFREVSGTWTVSDWSPDGTRVVAVESISINESYLHLIEVATGKTETLTPRPKDPKDKRSFAGEAKWSKDGEAIYYISDKNSEVRQLVRQIVGFGIDDVDVLTAPNGDIEEFDLSDDGAMMSVVVNEDGVSQIISVQNLEGLPAIRFPVMPNQGIGGVGVALPPGDTGKVPGPLFPQVTLGAASSVRGPFFPQAFAWGLGTAGQDPWSSGVVSGLAFRAGSHEVGFTLSYAQSSADSYSCKVPPAMNGIEQSPPARWTTSELGGLNPDFIRDPRRIEYPSFDGRKIPAFAYYPSPAKFPGPRPVLIDIHGGPEGQFRPRFLGRLNYLIDELGLVLIFPNVRGSSGYGKSYLRLDNGKLRGDAVKDIGALFDWIAKQKDLDKSRVAVTGGSYGGFMSLAVQANYNDKIKCGIDIVGISNFVTFLKNTQGYRRDLRRAEYGDERDPEMRAYLEKVSPLASAGKIRTPILVVQGQNDPRVPTSEAEQMVAAFKKNGIPVWYVVGTNEGHGFAKKPNQDYIQAVEVAFLRRYLLGQGEPQAAKVGKRFPVSGTVTLNGQPLAEGHIAFHPTEPGGHSALGIIRDGRFTLRTVDPNDGALPGSYKVTITSRDPGSKIAARYAHPDTTTLRCQVAALSNTVDFDLTD